MSAVQYYRGYIPEGQVARQQRLEKMANVSTPGGFSTAYNRGILCLFGYE